MRQRKIRTDNRGQMTYHVVSPNIGLGHVLGFLYWFLANNLYPVIIWIQNECDMAHSTVGKFLLEPIAGILNPLACRLEVIHADTSMAETSIGLPVSWSASA